MFATQAVAGFEILRTADVPLRDVSGYLYTPKEAVACQLPIFIYCDKL